MLDILLKPDGDLHISDSGDICLTESVRQAVRVRLRWFLAEWRFWPDTGVPYFEDILLKDPDLLRVRRIVREEAMSVEGVTDAQGIAVNVDVSARRASISLLLVVGEETYREEVTIPWETYTD